MIGKGDWDVLTSPKPPEMATPANFAAWIKGESKVEAVLADKDVFGDGNVMMLNMPGYTPGHHSLLVELPKMGTVFVTGDLAHFRVDLHQGNPRASSNNYPPKGGGTAR